MQKLDLSRTSAIFKEPKSTSNIQTNIMSDSDIEMYEEMIDNPTKHQIKAIRHARERACIDAMKSSTSKNPHNKGSNLAGLWNYVYEEYYQIQ